MATTFTSTTLPASRSSDASSVKDTRDSAVKKAEGQIATRKLLEEERARRLEVAQAKDRPSEVSLGPGETAGAQTRGGPKLKGSSAERGELIGMRSGVPIYATSESLYGQAPRSADVVPAGASGPVRPALTQEDIRAEYQAREAPKAAAAMATPESTKYWSPAAAQKYDQAVAREAALARVGGAAEATRRESEAAKSAKFMGDVVKTSDREDARKQIAAGTASPALVAKYPELNPLRSIAGAGEQDYGKSLTQAEMDLVNARLFRSRLPQAETPKAKSKLKFASVRK